MGKSQGGIWARNRVRGIIGTYIELGGDSSLHALGGGGERGGLGSFSLVQPLESPDPRTFSAVQHSPGSFYHPWHGVELSRSHELFAHGIVCADSPFRVSVPNTPPAQNRRKRALLFDVELIISALSSIGRH